MDNEKIQKLEDNESNNISGGYSVVNCSTGEVLGRYSDEDDAALAFIILTQWDKANGVGVGDDGIISYSIRKDEEPNNTVK